MGFYEDEDEFKTENSYANRIGKGSQLTNFIKNNEVNITTGDERIKEAILDVLSTRVGTRFFLPQYGCRVWDIMFEQNMFVIQDLACEYVKEDLHKWEPRVEVLEISATADDKTLEVYFTYRVRDLGTVGSFVYTIDRKVPPMD